MSLHRASASNETRTSGMGATESDRAAPSTSFAIVMPVACWHPLLPAALESVAKQSPRPQVAFLDASGDARVAAAADACGIRFAYRRHGPDDGQAAAIAEGWRKTRSDVVSWLNADDLLTPGALALAADAFADDSELGVFYGGSDFIDADGAVTGAHLQVEDVGPLLYRSNLISQPSCFVRRAAIEAVGGINPDLNYTMDWDLWVRLYAAGVKFKRTDAVLSRVYMGKGTKTARISPARLGEIARLVSRHAGAWNALKSTLSVALHPLRATS